MNACPNLAAELARLVADLARAPYCARGTIEAREKPIAGLLDLVATEALELRTGHRVVPLARGTPSARRRRGAGSPAEAHRQIAELRLDVALIEINLGDESGLEIVRQLSREPRDAAAPDLVLISTHGETEYSDPT